MLRWRNRRQVQLADLMMQGNTFASCVNDMLAYVQLRPRLSTHSTRPNLTLKQLRTRCAPSLWLTLSSPKLGT